MKQLQSFFVWLKDIVKISIVWLWGLVTRVFQYLVETSFKLVFCVWGMVLLTIFVLAISFSALLFAGASYSSTPQALIVIEKLKPTIERMAGVADVQINKSLDRYEEEQKEWASRKMEWEKDKK